MARELGLNPDKLGKIDNHRQETWKAPLPEFIEEIYFKRFRKERPDMIKPLKQILKEEELKAQTKKQSKEKCRKLRTEVHHNVYGTRRTCMVLIVVSSALILLPYPYFIPVKSWIMVFPDSFSSYRRYQVQHLSSLYREETVPSVFGWSKYPFRNNLYN